MKLKKRLLRCNQCNKYIGCAETIGQPLVYCADKCRKRVKLEAEQTESFELIDVSLCAGTKGAYAELLACAVLLGRGYDVYRSVSPNARCDLVIIKKGRMLKIEVRTGRSGDDSISFTRKDRDNADFYAVYHLKAGQPQIAFIKRRKMVLGKVNFLKPAAAKKLIKRRTKFFPAVSY